MKNSFLFHDYRTQEDKENLFNKLMMDAFFMFIYGMCCVTKTNLCVLKQLYMILIARNYYYLLLLKLGG